MNSTPILLKQPEVSIAMGTNRCVVWRFSYWFVFDDAAFSAAAPAASDVAGRCDTAIRRLHSSQKSLIIRSYYYNYNYYYCYYLSGVSSQPPQPDQRRSASSRFISSGTLNWNSTWITLFRSAPHQVETVQMVSHKSFGNIIDINRSGVSIGSLYCSMRWTTLLNFSMKVLLS